ncbi:MAG: hypothetical protein JWN52_7958 [Actinomycetia bacterium]|nr:hypothetical protein [Actinomycetes bacterium]
MSSSNLARWPAIIGMLGVAIANLALLPLGFHIAAYLGVMAILAAGMALASAAALFTDDTNLVWALALAEGVLNAAGYLVTRLTGLPFAEPYSLRQWSQPATLAIALLGTAVAGLASWTLHTRRGRPCVSTPVTSALERERRGVSGVGRARQAPHVKFRQSRRGDDLGRRRRRPSDAHH